MDYFFSTSFSSKINGSQTIVFVQPFCIGLKSEECHQSFQLSNLHARAFIECITQFKINSIIMKEEFKIEEKTLLEDSENVIQVTMINVRKKEQTMELIVYKMNKISMIRKRLLTIASSDELDTILKLIIEMYGTAITNNTIEKYLIKKLIVNWFDNFTSSKSALHHFEKCCEEEMLITNSKKDSTLNSMQNLIIYNRKYIIEWAHLLEINGIAKCNSKAKELSAYDIKPILIKLVEELC